MEITTHTCAHMRMRMRTHRVQGTDKRTGVSKSWSVDSKSFDKVQRSQSSKSAENIPEWVSWYKSQEPPQGIG